MWGVSKKGIFQATSYTAAYGICASSFKTQAWYPGYSARYYKLNNRISREHFHFKEGEVDMLLDVDKGELKFCVVGLCDDKYQAILCKLPKKNNWMGTRGDCFDRDTDLYGRPTNALFP